MLPEDVVEGGKVFRYITYIVVYSMLRSCSCTESSVTNHQQEQEV